MALPCRRIALPDVDVYKRQVLNTVLDPLFIFVLKMGVRGAAVATIISQAVSAAWVDVYKRQILPFPHFGSLFLR